MITSPLKTFLKRLLARPSVELCAVLPLPFVVKATRGLNGIQLDHRELSLVIAAVKRKAPCNFLVFGLGNDSVLWSRVNRGGNTVFVEDDEGWFRKVLAAAPRLKAHLVVYGTRRTRWHEFLDCPRLLDMTLPDEVGRERWDAILVDAPAGWYDEAPGRMKSIYHASRLAGDGGDVFVHDCDRQTERAYCDRFLKPDNLKAEVGLLRYYRVAGRRS